MKSANAKIVEPTPEDSGFEIVSQPEVSWDRARELWEQAKNRARLSGDALVELGRTLVALRKEFFSVGGRPANSNTPVGVSPKGWEKKVEEETGIEPWTARRLIDDAKYTIMARSVAEGESVRYFDSKKQEVIIEPTQELIEEAQKALPEIELGLVKPSTAWRGIMGEGLRRTKQGGAKERAPVDHAGVMKRAIKSLLVGAKVYAELPNDDRHDLDRAWANLAQAIPSHWAAMVAKGGK